MASLSKSSWQNLKERPNQSTNNGDLALVLSVRERVIEGVSESLSGTLVREKLSF